MRWVGVHFERYPAGVYQLCTIEFTLKKIITDSNTPKKMYARSGE